MEESGESGNLHGPAGHAEAPGRQRRVFISYASHDVPLAQKVCSALEAAGFPCWIAPRNVVPGTLYAEGIVRAIDDSTIVVLILSEQAVASAHVGKELERATSKRHAIIALRTDIAPLTPAFEYFLNESQWIEMGAGGTDAAIAQLVGAIGQHLTPTNSIALTHTHQVPAVRGKAATPRRSWIIAGGFVVLALVAAYFLADKAWLNGHTTTASSFERIGDKSIAVLPFTDMSEKKDQEYFADGMAEEIIDLLVQIPGLKVISRTSSFQFKGRNEDLRTVGTQLGVAYVLEGSVRKSGDRLRVTAQLIGTHDGSHAWSETYDEDVGDVLKVQDRIAAGLVRALQVTIGADNLQSRPEIKNPEAYDLYLRGRHAFDRFDKAGAERAINYFQQALALDPSSVGASEWLANAEELLPEMGFVPPREGYERARASVQRALLLNPKSGVMHSLLADIHAIYDWDWPAAEEEAKRALALDPGNAFVLTGVGEVYTALGQFDEGARLYTAALAVDPLFAGTHMLLGNLRIGTGRFVEAETEYRKVLEISPTYVYAHFCLGWTLLAEGKLEAALAEMQRESADGGRDLGLSMVYHAMGRKAESDAALARYTKEYSETDPYGIADAHAYRGETDQAFDWLERAYRQREAGLYTIKRNPNYKILRPDPRYREFLRKMNLPD